MAKKAELFIQVYDRSRCSEGDRIVRIFPIRQFNAVADLSFWYTELDVQIDEGLALLGWKRKSKRWRKIEGGREADLVRM